MHITFAPKGILQIDDARIVYRNFAGAASQYNRAGDRNFAVVIPDQDQADALIEKGWNVKIKPPRDADDSPFMYIPVKIAFNDYGPTVYLKSGNRTVKLSEDNVECLDNIDILSVDMDLRPYDWERPDGRSGRSAYLQSIRVIQKLDRFAPDYDDDLPIE